MGLLEDLEDSPGAVDATTYVPPGGRVPADWGELPRSAEQAAAGLALASGPEFHMAVAPPFPPETGPDTATYDGAAFGPMKEALLKPRVVAIVLLRLGAYAIGVTQNGELVESKTGTRWVKGRHKAGGQSQRRFERRREEWAAKLYGEACEVAEARIAPFSDALDALAMGGEKHVLNDFRKRCRFVAELQGRLPVLRVAVDRPGRRALELCSEGVWDSVLWVSPGLDISAHT
ncbi:MAG: Vms1/Ankzf1 family peptidyl-tRNA hydrolase [Chloroflexota bacterium]